MIKEEHIIKLVKDHLKGSDQFLVSVKIKPGNRIFVFIDSDTSVCIDDCVQLNRFLESQLDREIEDFELKISSSGLDQPIILLRQYKKNIGKQIEVVTHDGSKKKGLLLKADDKMIEMEIFDKTSKSKTINTGNMVAISLNDIKETKQVISFKKT